MKNCFQYILLFVTWTGYVLNAQERCGLEERAKFHKINLEDEAYKASYDHFYRNESHEKNRDQNTLFIAVHVIVLHPPNELIGSQKNPDESIILSQIEALNRDFQRLNADTINTPSVFSVGNPNIAFCMASIDPQGNPTDGISRYEYTKKFQSEESIIKNATSWPRQNYLNIWVADIDNLGFSYVPSNSNLPSASLDGVVIDYKVFGGPDSGAEFPYNEGRTATHEVGHFLGLSHIWYTSGCNGDDGMADTPLQNKSHMGCPAHPYISCNNIGDMFMNYMDYTDDACMNAFSKDQSSYMRSILKGIRFSLMASGKTMCQDTSVSIKEEWTLKNNFKIGPNPVKDNLVVEYFGNKNEEVNIKIYDIFGKLISDEGEILFSAEKKYHNIFVNNVANSIFMIKIASKFKSTHYMIYKD